ncbi:uridylate kinase [Methylobacterium dankookense]|uniref:Aspartate/glutamate/uridylate kinase domain-containing protein n=1 Tax=Methylobacterium dankookense TaxID=560405 RepID=A0A564FZY2_9HYPH|nr:uridylate kinase [Methylobacterium dankookense]GJD57342.1 hypothetical protein IFDJLNFL_3243 [Methylobacterium dankookense]VUF13250.1 hypothetical protein MTDSW087_02950 [Methylobacterium dankookense]
MSAAPIVVKLGGSLLGEPARLRAWLARLTAGALGPCLIVPGGGPFADAVRNAQGALGFDDALAHRLALDAMGRMAEVFCALEPGLEIVSDLPVPASAPLPVDAQVSSPVRERDRMRVENDPESAEPGALHRCDLTGAFSSLTPTLSRTGEGARRASREAPRARVWDPRALRAGHPDIPESWAVTSDSLALWLATETGAPACLLVKSAPAPRGSGPQDWARLGLVDAAFPAFAARYPGEIRIEGPADGRVAA